MYKFKRILAILAIFGALMAPNPVKASDVPVAKVNIGAPFTYFDLSDIYHQRWVSTYLRGKPTIILTGHRYQRYEILKWAEAFRMEYQNTGKAHVLWVVNLRKCPWNTSRETVYNQWRTFNSSVPVLLDWDGVVGKSLRVNYNVPNIIVLDAYGRLVMHEMHTYNESVYGAVSARIKQFAANGMDLTGPRKKQKKGRRSDSF